MDASGARVHDGPQGHDVAQAHRAEAVTHGRDMYFARGAYAPGTSEGDALIAHEFQHVRQHALGELGSADARGVSDPREPAERQADAAATAFQRGDELDAQREDGLVRKVGSGPGRRMRYVQDEEGNTFYRVDVSITTIEWGQPSDLVFPFLVPLSVSEAQGVESVPGHAELVRSQLRAILNPVGEPTRESPDFLLGPGFSAVLARDLRRVAESGVVALTSTAAFVQGRAQTYQDVQMVTDLEDYLVAKGAVVLPVAWHAALDALSYEDPFEPVTASDRSFLIQYRLFLDMLRVELADHDDAPGSVMPSVEDLHVGIMDYFADDQVSWGDTRDWRSEAFLDHWMARLASVTCVPADFTIADHEPTLDAEQIDRERERVLSDWLAPVPSGRTVFGGNSRAADLLTQYVLDEWAMSSLDPDAFLATLDVQSFRAEAVDAITEAFLAHAKEDEALRAVAVDYAIEQARWDTLRGIYVGAVALERGHGADATALLTKDLAELEEREQWIAADPYYYVTLQERIGAASYGFFEAIAGGTALEPATVTLVDSLWAALGVEGLHPHLALGFELAIAANHLHDTYTQQLKLATSRIRDALDAQYDDIAEIVTSHAEYADRFVAERWVPMLKTVATKRLTENRDELTYWLDNWRQETPRVLARYDLAAAVLEQAAEDLRSGEVEALELQGERVTAADAERIENAAALMRASAAQLRDPDQAADRRDEIREAVAGFDAVIEGVKNEDPYKPWHLGPSVVGEARERLGLAGFDMPVTYGMVLSRTFVARDNPFLMYAITRWEYRETVEEQLNTVALFAGLGLLSVAALAVPGVGGALLALVDIGVSLYQAGGSVQDAYGIRRMARLDTDLSVYGVSEEQADDALSNAWIGLVVVGVFAAVGGALAGITILRSGARMARNYRFPNLLALEGVDPALLSQLLQMTRNARQLESLLAGAGNAQVLRQLLLYGSADDVARMLGQASDARSLLTVLGAADDLAHADRLLGVSSDTAAIARVLHDVPLAARIADDALLALSGLDDAALALVGTADSVTLADIARLARSDAGELSRVFQAHGIGVVDHLRWAPASDVAALGKALDRASNRVVETPGLYQSIPPAAEGRQVFRGGWTVETSRYGATDWSTEVFAPSGEQMSLSRMWDPQTGELVMDAAFANPGTPRVENPVPMLPASSRAPAGTPAMTYMSLAQMRAMGIPHGAGASAGGIRTVKMSNIQNIEAIAHLQWLRDRHPDVPIGELARRTHSVRYAETILNQAGYRITQVHVSGGGTAPISVLTQHYEGSAPFLFGQTSSQRVDVHSRILSRYGFSRETEMFQMFDIKLEVAPR